MAKQSGLGDNFYFAGRNISGDTSTVTTGQPVAVLESTGIDKSAMERMQGLRSGSIEFLAFFNDAVTQSHNVLKGLSTADRGCMYTRGTAIGSAAACCVSKHVDWTTSRPADGSLTMNVSVQSNGFGLEWGQLLTAGIRSDTGATNGASLDTTASASFGGQAYLQAFDFTGTDATVKIQDSADDSSWADVSGFAFTQLTGGTTTERIALSNTATIRRYVRAVTVTTGGFSLLTFAVALIKNSHAGVVF